MSSRRTFLKQLGAVVGIVATVPLVTTKVVAGVKEQYSDVLYIGGNFCFIDIENARQAHLSKWDGTEWKAIMSYLGDLNKERRDGASEADYIHWFSGDEWREV